MNFVIFYTASTRRRRGSFEEILAALSTDHGLHIHSPSAVPIFGRSTILPHTCYSVFVVAHTTHSERWKVGDEIVSLFFRKNEDLEIANSHNAS
jgi:hypothetical protein